MPRDLLWIRFNGPRPVTRTAPTIMRAVKKIRKRELWIGNMADDAFWALSIHEVVTKVHVPIRSDRGINRARTQNSRPLLEATRAKLKETGKKAISPISFIILDKSINALELKIMDPVRRTAFEPRETERMNANLKAGSFEIKEVMRDIVMCDEMRVKRAIKNKIAPGGDRKKNIGSKGRIIGADSDKIEGPE